MKDNLRLLVTLGFAAVLALMLTLAAISLLQLQSINARMEKLVNVTNMKTMAVNDMRDAIRLRADSLKSMQLAKDMFARETGNQHLIDHAGKYSIARDNFINLGLDEREAAINRQLQQLTRASQPYNDDASELLMSNAPAEEINTVMEQASRLEGLILDKLEQLLQLEQQNTQEGLTASRNRYTRTRQLLFALTAMALLLSLLISGKVNKFVAAKNRQLSYHASHDPLTGLVNRREFECRVERAIQNANSQASTHALLYLDLEQFKVINDTCGRATGDELLQQLAQLLLGSVRYRDTLGRLGGDEFGMLFENCPLDKAVEIANNLVKAIDDFSFTWGDTTFTLGISIGVFPIDRSTTDIASAMSAADSACYIAKESGRNQVQVAHMGDRRLQERHGDMQWAPRLARALEEDRFTLYFQPIIPCAGKSAYDKHIEILLRLIDDDGSVIAPGSFLPAAEKYNLVSSIDRWVIEHTMKWQAEINATGNRPVTVAMNLSGQTVSNPAMLEFIIDMMEATGVSAEHIIFEITETVAIANITAVTSFMLALRGCGCRFSLDDFGSGIFSFTYLKKLPVDFLKIDGVFIRDILSDPVDHAMVKAINKLAQLLGKETVAKFVETHELADELRLLGINHVQGHAYAIPRPIINYMQDQPPHLVLVSS